MSSNPIFLVLIHNRKPKKHRLPVLYAYGRLRKIVSRADRRPMREQGEINLPCSIAKTLVLKSVNRINHNLSAVA